MLVGLLKLEGLKLAKRKYGLGSIAGDAYVAGRREGEARGWAEGVIKGEAKLARLMSALLAEGRTDLALRVVDDLALRADLYHKYEIE